MGEKRLARDFKKIEDNPIPNISQVVWRGDCYKWKCIINAPPQTPYEGGEYELYIDFAHKHPFEPPKLRFMTKIYHPFVSKDGNVYQQLLLPKLWSPAFQIRDILDNLVKSIFTDTIEIEKHEQQYGQYGQQHGQYGQHGQHISSSHAILNKDAYKLMNNDIIKYIKNIHYCNKFANGKMLILDMNELREGFMRFLCDCSGVDLNEDLALYIFIYSGHTKYEPFGQYDPWIEYIDDVERKKRYLRLNNESIDRDSRNDILIETRNNNGMNNSKNNNSNNNIDLDDDKDESKDDNKEETKEECVDNSSGHNWTDSRDSDSSWEEELLDGNGGVTLGGTNEIEQEAKKNSLASGIQARLGKNKFQDMYNRFENDDSYNNGTKIVGINNNNNNSYNKNFNHFKQDRLNTIRVKNPLPPATSAMVIKKNVTGRSQPRRPQLGLPAPSYNPNKNNRSNRLNRAKRPKKVATSNVSPIVNTSNVSNGSKVSNVVNGGDNNNNNNNDNNNGRLNRADRSKKTNRGRAMKGKSSGSGIVRNVENGNSIGVDSINNRNNSGDSKANRENKQEITENKRMVRNIDRSIRQRRNEQPKPRQTNINVVNTNVVPRMRVQSSAPMVMDNSNINNSNNTSIKPSNARIINKGNNNNNNNNNANISKSNLIGMNMNDNEKLWYCLCESDGSRGKEWFYIPYNNENQIIIKKQYQLWINNNKSKLYKTVKVKVGWNDKKIIFADKGNFPAFQQSPQGLIRSVVYDKPDNNNLIDGMPVLKTM